MNLNKRQSLILDYINSKGSISRLEIQEYISNKFEKTSKITIVRDLEILLEKGLIVKSGQARSVTYKPINDNDLLIYYNPDEYFRIDMDDRLVKYPRFNFNIFEKFFGILSQDEVSNFENVNQIYRSNISKLSPIVLKKEFERLTIELSWKSSKIEGNTYSLLDTEALIKNNIEASGHKKEEAVMILNHKKALDFIFENQDYYKELTLQKIEELHEILTNGLDVRKGLRTLPVGIVGTNYRPLDNQMQIRDSMDKFVELINSTSNVIEKALFTVLLISYIQPFEDGNKRTGRILANALLYSNGYCPLSYRSVSESEYKKAIIIFYENNSLAYFKQLFTEQFKFAVDKYF